MATTLTSSSTTATSAPPTTTFDTGDLAGWELSTVRVGETALLVAVADEPGERSQGLMGVEDLGQVEGMLFVFPRETTGGFWMKDTIIPLDIAFFSEDGSLVEVLTMPPCQADPCPSYSPQGQYLWALEAPAGALAELGADTFLALP